MEGELLKLKLDIRNMLSSRLLGAYQQLNMLARRTRGVGLVDLIIEDPLEAYNLLSSFYREAGVDVQFLARELIAKPIALKMGRLELEHRILSALLKGDRGELESIWRELGLPAGSGGARLKYSSKVP